MQVYQLDKSHFIDEIVYFDIVWETLAMLFILCFDNITFLSIFHSGRNHFTWIHDLIEICLFLLLVLLTVLEEINLLQTFDFDVDLAGFHVFSDVGPFL